MLLVLGGSDGSSSLDSTEAVGPGLGHSVGAFGCVAVRLDSECRISCGLGLRAFRLSVVLMHRAVFCGRFPCEAMMLQTLVHEVRSELGA